MFRPLRSGNALVVRYCLRAFSLKFLGRLRACLRNLFTIISLVFWRPSRFIMPKTPRAVSSAPFTISTPPVSEILASVSSLASVSIASGQPARSATREPLLEGQYLRDRDLFENFCVFLIGRKPHTLLRRVFLLFRLRLHAQFTHSPLLPFRVR